MVAGAAAAEAAGTSRLVDYLYIAANEGGSSGGHAAIRFERETYHFQHHPPGVLRLHRDDSARFLHVYGNLENRPIHVTRIAVSDETYALLRDRFNQRYLGDSAAFATLEAVRTEEEVLALLLACPHSDQPATLRLAGAGYFFPEGERTLQTPQGAPPLDIGDSALRALRARIETALGAGCIARRLEDVARSVASLRPDESETAGLHLAGALTTPRLFSRRYLDLVTALVALRVLRDAVPLQPASYHAPQTDGFRLAPAEMEALRGVAARLAGDLTQLMTSARPDWGFPLLVGMARLQALHASVDSGRLVFLDTFPPDSVVIDRERLGRYADMLPELLEEAREQFATARAGLTASQPVRETEVAQVEAAANRLLELQRAVTESADLRVSAATFLPARSAAVTDLPIPNLSATVLMQSLTEARVNAEQYAEALENAYRYNLLTHNCVSEIFATINAAFALPAAGAGDDNASRVATQSRQRLGGFIAAGESLTFIPFVSATSVDHSYNVAATRALTPYRQVRLSEMYAHESPLLVYMRESNTLSSTIYRGSCNDSAFLFFTDDTWLLRPIFGLVNVATGAVASVAGLALLPARGAAPLTAGLKGMLFSMPELAFVNLRKGSFDYVPRKYHVDPLDVVDGSASPATFVSQNR